jgi:hypothetical protein
MDKNPMSDDLPFFHRMLAALLEAPEDVEMDQLRAQMVLDSAGSDAVEAAIAAGDPYAAALWRLAVGDTREALRRWIERGGAKG